jgi:hypothetical protein
VTLQLRHCRRAADVESSVECHNPPSASVVYGGAHGSSGYSGARYTVQVAENTYCAVLSHTIPGGRGNVGTYLRRKHPENGVLCITVLLCCTCRAAHRPPKGMASNTSVPTAYAMQEG